AQRPSALELIMSISDGRFGTAPTSILGIAVVHWQLEFNRKTQSVAPAVCAHHLPQACESSRCHHEDQRPWTADQ
ncbi:MAG: hypothetical protein ACRESY_06115, partial [Steroidobacteraceae bacterium]